MAWSTSDISTLKMSFFWNDSAEDVAFILGKDVAEVQAKARELGIHLQTLRGYRPNASTSSIERTTAQSFAREPLLNSDIGTGGRVSTLASTGRSKRKDAECTKGYRH